MVNGMAKTRSKDEVIKKLDYWRRALAEEEAHLGILPAHRYAHALAMVALLEWFLGEEGASHE